MKILLPEEVAEMPERASNFNDCSPVEFVAAIESHGESHQGKNLLTRRNCYAME